MKGVLVKGTLRGVADGPLIIVDVRGEEKAYPLDCDLTLEWVQSHLGKPVTCLVDETRVKQVV
ncbi:MAG: hypothetical protein HYX99_04360 [Chloroflexi bacterium]|nr:hypothetical protein [Chloroflexota bacterium]